LQFDPVQITGRGCNSIPSNKSAPASPNGSATPRAQETTTSFFAATPRAQETTTPFFAATPRAQETTTPFFAATPRAQETTTPFLGATPRAQNIPTGFLAATPRAQQSTASFLTAYPSRPPKKVPTTFQNPTTTLDTRPRLAVPIAPMAIGTTIKTIQDIMRKDTGVDGDAQRIGQLVWMLFLKILDDREIEKEGSIKRYRSPLPNHLRWGAWAAQDDGITGDALLAFVNNNLFPQLQALPGTDPLSTVVRSVFEDAYNYMKSGTLLRQVINKLNDIDFNRSSDRHEIGGIYEQLLSDLRGAGNAGEYYTPRAVTAFLVERINPQLGETVLDPACGTGGFLVCTIDHLREKYKKTAADEQKIQASIRGIEKKPLPHLLCMTNMILHQIDAPTQIRRHNALDTHRRLQQVGSGGRDRDESAVRGH
jgi:hypothetical protein